MGTTVGRRLVRGAALSFAVVVLLAPGSALAKTSSSSFVYGPDSKNWYWKDQIQKKVGTGPVAQYVTLGNPQADDTLPVAAQNGQPDKVSAIAFDLTQRGITVGSVVTKFVFTILESDDAGAGFKENPPDTQPSFNQQGKVIEACPITGIWASGDGAELWDEAPAHDASCVAGKRLSSGGSVRWSFDVTTAAAGWATNPVSNLGVMLVPEIVQGASAKDSTWQINLKIPMRDDSSTKADEYQQTKGRLQLDVAFSAPVSSGTTPPATTTTIPSTLGGTGGLGTGITGTGFPTTSTPTTGQPTATGGPARAASTRSAPTVGRFPWYVWMLIPVGLVALSTVRGVVLEPLTPGRPSGVIAAIRTKNAELRGMGSRGARSATRRQPVPGSAFANIGRWGRQARGSLSALTRRTRRALRRR